MPTKTQAIKAFLTARTHSDLASMYNHNMECQVLVAAGKGEKVEGDYEGIQWSGYTDGLSVWKPIRIPRNASTEPVYLDDEMKFDLGLHAEGVGMTGYDWFNKTSKWVGFDFDAILGHSDKHSHKLSSEELKRVQDAACGIDWVTVRRSTSGKGLHLYVMLPDVPTINHTEHAALGRAILHKMNSLVGFDFTSKVDACVTGNTWTLTSEGPRQVRELINTSCELTVNGINHQTEGFFKTGSQEVFELETVEGHTIQATANHPFLVDYDGLQFWQHLDTLKIGDVIKLNEHKNVSWEGSGTYDEGYILGWLMGDGFIWQNKRPGGHEKVREGYEKSGLYFLEPDHCLLNYVKRLFKLEPHQQYWHETQKYMLSGPELEHLRIEYSLDEYKRITEQIEEASSDFQKGFLSAFFDSDGGLGHTTRSLEVKLTQSNLPRLQAVQRMLGRFGINSSISLERKAGRMLVVGRMCNTKDKYCLVIRKQNIVVFKNIIGFRHKEKNKDLLESIVDLQSGRKGLQKESFACRVKSIKSVGIENTYDVTVPKVHAFDANGFLVHNCGGNLWVWNRKMIGTDGLTCIKRGSIISEDQVPANWRDHIKVARGLSKKLTAPTEISNLEDTEDRFDVLCGQRNRIKLDEQHIKFITFMNQNGLYHWFDSDRHMLVTHTLHVKRAHRELGLKGTFETESTGSSEYNCYLFPMRRGAWSVRRFTPGIKEHKSWEQDGQGWTRTYLNQDPSFKSAAHAHGGTERPSGGFHFRLAEDAQNAAQSLGTSINVPTALLGRQTNMKPHKDGNRLVIEIPYESHDNQQEGWLHEGKNWVKIFSAQRISSVEIDTENFDDIVRHLVTESGQNADWVINSDGRWNDEPLHHVKAAMVAMNIKKQEIDQIIGSSVMKPWTLVSRPFQEEYPGDRTWNRFGTQFKYPPTISDTFYYPTWQKILSHIGKTLDSYLGLNAWAKKNGIKTGSDYLKMWIASMIQFPSEPLPYLFLYSETQETGKSTLHEALSLLFSPGCVSANHALENKSTFNAELEGAILCAIEEIDVNQNKTAYVRVKDWVTAPKLSVHRKGETPYMIDNTVHFIQTGQHPSFCPAFPGDTRITMIQVKDKPEEPIPKRLLIRALEKEASDFIGMLLSIEVPDCDSRLRIPVIETPDKLKATNQKLDPIGQFLSECCHKAPGYKITLEDFFERFVSWLEPGDRQNWGSKRKISQHMPDWVLKGRSSVDGQPVWHWLNISFSETIEERLPYEVVGETARLMKGN